MTAYVDGVLSSTTPNTLGTTSDFIGIGVESPSGNDVFDGMMDNLRIWSRGLFALEVAEAAAR